MGGQFDSGAQTGISNAAGSDKKVLEVIIDEATEINKESQNNRDDELTEGFMKVEVRGPDGTRPIRMSTKSVSVSPDRKMVWHEPVQLELFEGCSELRLLLCRESYTNGRRSVHVVCACGIFVQHILDAVPIDKYFEMFKPGSGSDGGYVRLKMRLVTPADNKTTKRETKGKRSALTLASVALSIFAVGFAILRPKK